MSSPRADRRDNHAAHTALRNECLAWIGSREWARAWIANVGVAVPLGRKRPMRFGIAGQADITGILRDGRRLEIEIKTGNARRSSNQRAYASMIVRMGGLYVVARSLDWLQRELRVDGYHDSS